MPIDMTTTSMIQPDMDAWDEPCLFDRKIAVVAYKSKEKERKETEEQLVKKSLQEKKLKEEKQELAPVLSKLNWVNSGSDVKQVSTSDLEENPPLGTVVNREKKIKFRPTKSRKKQHLGSLQIQPKVENLLPRRS